LYDYRNRFYHPGLGRFLQPDPIGFAGDSSNLYRYCGGDPVNRRDPSGLEDFPEEIKRSDNGTDPFGWPTTDRVVVDAPYDWSQGSFEPVGPGGLESLNQGGGHNTGEGGGHFLANLPPLPRDSSGKGTVPSAPKSTQGFWTDMSGLPTGPNINILTDAWLRRVLGQVYQDILDFEYGDDIRPGELDWRFFMSRYDTEFYGNSVFRYEGQYENLRGTWVGFQVNYIGVGEGFAGHSVSRSGMADWVGWWNYREYQLPFVSAEVEGKMMWAELGYDYFSARFAGGR
jgi:hypothetical protein